MHEAASPEGPGPRGPVIPVVTFLEPIQEDPVQFLFCGLGKSLSQSFNDEGFPQLGELEDFPEYSVRESSRRISR
jgi:hypothetical protein